MCRLFGFRSVIQSQVHSSLVHAENALSNQSLVHPDGWGVSYYINNIPHVIKSDKTAINDSIFKTVSGIVSSQTVLAHLRKATLGEINILNTHPFQFGSWTFAHNGNIKDFKDKRAIIEKEIYPQFKRFIIGKTDSEVIFYFLISRLSRWMVLDDPELRVQDVMDAVSLAIKDLVQIIGPVCVDEGCGPTENYLTFILTNGKIMVGHCGGKPLYYSTYKKKCNDRDTCRSYTSECEAPTKTGNINHLIFSSEPLSGENIWIKMENFQLIGVDSFMKLTIK